MLVLFVVITAVVLIPYIWLILPRLRRRPW
jgi:hypothetical protein